MKLYTIAGCHGCITARNWILENIENPHEVIVSAKMLNGILQERIHNTWWKPIPEVEDLSFPFLVTDDKKIIKGADEILDYLKESIS